MKNIYLKRILTIFLLLIGIGKMIAAPNAGIPIRKFDGKVKKMAAGCSPATASVDLDINNVRARILNGGDMWWDLVATARYEIPKVTEANGKRKTSLFAGSLWIGGFERSNLKLAAMTYRQNGSDFYPGPVDTTDGSVDASQCIKYDKIWKVSKTEIDQFRAGTAVAENITNWPGNPIDLRNANQGFFLAPYIDVDLNGVYNPSPNGGLGSDYPDIRGDQALWFVYNDVGNVHSETKSNPIGLEVRTMAFAFKSNDQISNMTFYKNTIINRGRGRLDSCYFGQWADPDLGYAFDDYVACDTSLDLGICYNGDDVDEGETGYGINPPSIGIDFFQGPTADDSDKVDNNRDGVIDEKGEKIGMSKFVYYDNEFTNFGNPELPEHYYNYLVGKWKNGKFVVNDSKRGQTSGSRANYMFPGDPASTDPNIWTERNAGNPPGDRRFIQSAGPFTLKPGSVNNVTVGVVWAKATSGGPIGSLSELKFADKKAQLLFDADFKSILGPEPPHVEIIEMDRKLVFTILNVNGSTDTTERFNKLLPSEIKGKFRRYKFEGYQIYQLKNSTTTSAELENTDKARLIAQVDLVNDVSILVNEEFDATVGSVKKLKVQGENRGIRHSFEITKDYFSTGNDQMVNTKFYYYTVVAYASNTDPNEKEKYLSGRPSEIDGNTQLRAIPHKIGEQLSGSNIRSDYGTIVQVTRQEGQGNGGVSLQLTKESEAELFKNGVKSIINRPVYELGKGPLNIRVYDPLRLQPFDYELKIYNPKTKRTLKTKDGNVINASKLDSSSRWTLYNRTPNYNGTLKEWNSDTIIGYGNEQIIPELGLSVKVNQVDGPDPKNEYVRNTNGFISATIEYKDPKNDWLSGIRDADPPGGRDEYKRGLTYPLNWIRSGKQSLAPSGGIQDVTDDVAVFGTSPVQYSDPKEIYEKLLGGTIAPGPLAARSFVGANGSYTNVMTLGPIPAGTLSNTPITGSTQRNSLLSTISSVDIVLTPDKSKWTKCIVLEMGEVPALNEGNATKFSLRKAKNPFVDGSNGPSYQPGVNQEEGTSWFPGYAVNQETGERLNIIFGEDSYLETENGRDMLWNPTNNYAGFNYQNPSSLQDPTSFITRYLWGGKHWMYVMNSRIQQNIGTNASLACFKTFAKEQGVPYDSGNTYKTLLSGGTCGSQTANIKFIMAGAMWVSCPVLNGRGKLNSVENGIVPTETRIKLRVEKPYSTLLRPSDINSPSDSSNFAQPRFTFSTSGIAPDKSVQIGKDNLKEVAMIPNPYYGFSGYETSQLDNRVRISNLPAKCIISIYSIDGSLIRRFNISNPPTNEYNPRTQHYVDWDMKNEARVPVASGAYIVHIDAGDLGEKIIKWFGVMRPIDLDTF